MAFDNLEYLSIKKQTTDFPLHYHETFCISLIYKGIEVIDWGHQKMYSEAGSITITNPGEIHANPLLDPKAHLEFDTIYISKDLMKYLFQGKSPVFVDQKIESQPTNEVFIQLRNALHTNNHQAVEMLLFKLADRLKYHVQETREGVQRAGYGNFENVISYIEHNITEKIQLEELSKIAHLNKFGFAKKFKALVGLTPIHYILMKKVFASKKLITADTELTGIAYEYNFSDMAHFSKTFKRFVGVSPKAYQQGIV